MTRAEVLLWCELKGRRLHGHKFHRQYGIGPFIADFYCNAVKLVIELDGESHFAGGAAEYDLKRDRYMKQLGIRTMRVLNSEVFDNRDNLVEMIGRVVEEREREMPGAFELRGRRCRNR